MNSRKKADVHHGGSGQKNDGSRDFAEFFQKSRDSLPCFRALNNAAALIFQGGAASCDQAGSVNAFQEEKDGFSQQRRILLQEKPTPLFAISETYSDLSYGAALL